jgi:branched-chain amino acid transport system permease protein
MVFEWLSSDFPDTYPILLGLLFIAVVFALPQGVLAGIDRLRARWTA